MTDLRTAAQQALEAFEEIAALRTGGMIQRRAVEHAFALREALEQPTQEPVAWMYFDSDGDAIFGHPNGYRPDDAVPVYTAPQPTGGNTISQMQRDEAPATDVSLLRQALEAFESKYIVNCGAWRVQQDKAIAALKERLK